MTTVLRFAAAPDPGDECGASDLVCKGTKKLGEVAEGAVDATAGKVADSALEKAAEFFREAAEAAIKTLTAAWLKAPDPKLEGENSPAVWLQDRLEYLVAVAMIGTLFFAAYKVAIRPSYDQVGGAAKALVRTVVVSAVGLGLITTGLEASDIFATWILDQADINLGDQQTAGLAMFTALNPGLVLILALVMVIVQIVQLLLMIVRNAAVVYLAATLPLAAASSGTRGGEQWWVKSLAWLIAFILYKPVAAFIYAGAFTMLDAKNGIVSQMTGVVACVMAIVALPAMLRLIVPATASVASGNAGATVMGLAGGAVATGAVIASGGSMAAFAGGFSGGGGAGGSFQSDAGPSGAKGAPADEDQGPQGARPPAGGSDSKGGDDSGSGGLSQAAGVGQDTARRLTDDASGALGEDNT